MILRDLEGAIRSYKAACEGLPRNIWAHAQLGKLLENDYPAEAFTAYVGALEIHPLASSPGDSAYVAHAGLQGLLEQHPAAVFGREITRVIRLLKDAPEGHPNALKQLSTTLDKCRSAVGDPPTDKNGNSDSR